MRTEIIRSYAAGALTFALAIAVSTAPLSAKEPPKDKAPALAVSAPPPPVSPNAVDYMTITRIRQEGFRNSKVMETLSGLTDSIGPRLTNSPNMRKANAWTRDQLTAFGLENAHLESWGPFGRGWSYEESTVRMTAPDHAEFIALPKAWTPGTDGPVRGKVVRANIKSKADFEKYKGKLGGAIVLVGDDREVTPHTEPQLERFSDKQLDDLFHYEIPGGRPNLDVQAFVSRLAFQKEVLKFLTGEKPLAVIEASRAPGDGGTIFVQGGGSYEKDGQIGPPWLVMSVEHFGRIARILERKQDVELEVNVKTTFYDDDPSGYNTIAEIPGSDLKDEVVMAGAHLDSWHGGTGATDNGAGSAIAMEAVRILKALDVKPRRTIRIALWSGEEQGLRGSRGYVAEHFASRPESADPKEKELPSFLRRETGPLTVKPEHARISAYFNLDNGTGKIRGIHLQENSAVAPIFEAWMEPFKDLGMTTLTMRNTGGTDHLSFDAVGIPGFQFIQDEIEYSTRTHHSNMDTYERLQSDDLKQASVIMASFLYQTAMRDNMLPRKPMPKDEPAKKEEAGKTETKK